VISWTVIHRIHDTRIVSKILMMLYIAGYKSRFVAFRVSYHPQELTWFSNVQPQVRTTHYGLQSFRFAGAKLWNELPTCFRKETSLNQFKNLINAFEMQLPCIVCNVFVNRVFACLVFIYYLCYVGFKSSYVPNCTDSK